MGIGPGVRFESYEILQRLAAGGMGEVWLARDVRLDRKVAIKVLPTHLTEDADRVARFRQEARAASALNHPNVCTIHALGTAADGRLFIAMEYIDGLTLRARLSGGPIPAPEAIDVAEQMASGLAAAHSAGVIHRDVKPENVMIRSDGLVKVLDFGLAKLDPAIASLEAFASTHTALPRDEGVGGTIAYMSPEQARGEALDPRTDIFSLGAVLYEMVTGRAPFSGSSPAVVHDGILNRTPTSPARVNPHVTARLEDIIMKALEKDRILRYQTVVDLRTDLVRQKTRASDASAAEPATQTQGRRGRPPRWRQRWSAGDAPEAGRSRAIGARVGVAALLIALVAFGAVRWGPLRSVLFQPELQELQLTTNSSENPITSVAVSPDGKYIAYADEAGIHLRLIDSRETHTIAAPEIGAVNLVRWFPDGSKLLVSGAALPGKTLAIWSMSIVGGTPRKLREGGLEANVSMDGSEIAFVDGERKHVWLMGVNGEEPHQIVSGSQGDQLHMPAFWPGGSRIGYARLRSEIEGAVKLELSVESIDHAGHALVAISDPGLRGGVLLPDGRFVYSLVAEPILERDPSLWEAHVDLQSGRSSGGRRIRDWSGQLSLWDFTTSADARRVVFFKRSLQKDVYLADLTPDGSIANPRRFTLDDSADFPTNWTPDGNTLFFTSDRNGSYDIFRQPLDSRTPEAIVSGPDDESGPTAVSPDGAWLYYMVSPKGWRLAPKRGDAVFRTPTAGGSRDKIADDSQHHWALCAKAPSTTCVLVEYDRTQLSIYSLDPRNGGRGRKLASSPLAYPWPSADISPDGSRVAVQLPAERRIRVLSLTGEAPRDVVVTGHHLDGSAFYWSADGAGWYVSSTPDRYPEGTDLLHIDINGRVTVVWHQNVRDVMSAIPSPDGRHIAVTAASTVSNVWMIKHF